MSTVILNTDTLPSPIKEKFHTLKVTIQDHGDGSVILSPLREIKELRGIGKGSKFTTEKLFEYRREEKTAENMIF
jgi:hypothetical protein